MKKCAQCKIEKPFDEFYTSVSQSGGFQSYCKPCSAIRRKEVYQNSKERHRTTDKNRQKFLQTNLLNYLKTHPCVDCDLGDIRVLEFDHLSDKTANVADMLRRGLKWSTIEKEIEKCEVVCKNCHAIRTYTRCGSYRILAPGSES